MRKTLRNTMLAVTLLAGPAIAEESDTARELVNFIFAPNTTDCIESALHNIVGSENSPIVWENTERADGTFERRLKTSATGGDFVARTARFDIIATANRVNRIRTAVKASYLFNENSIAASSVSGITTHFDNEHSEALADYTAFAEKDLNAQILACIYGDDFEQTDYPAREAVPAKPQP